MKPRVLLMAAAVCGLAGLAAAQQPQQNFDNVRIQVVPVTKNIYMLFGAGGNVTVQIGPDGVLLVDTEFEPLVTKLMAEIRKLSDGPIRYILNTHVHGDHVGGNDAFAKLVPKNPELPLNIIAQANVLNRLTAPGPNGTPGASAAEHPGFPEDEYDTPFKDLHFNGEAIFLYHEPKAHTDGDSVILFRGSDVVATGDIFTPGRYPFIDIARGGSVQGEIDALDHILELTVPADHQEGGTAVIPGHGRVCNEADVVEFRDMVVIVKDRIQDLIKKGKTLEQVKAARPTLDYDTEFGENDRLIEGVYKSLGGK